MNERVRGAGMQVLNGRGSELWESPDLGTELILDSLDDLHLKPIDLFI